MQKITKSHYDDIIERIQESYEYFKKEGYPDNNYTLMLADGKRVDYTISLKNIPHLLGLKLDDMANAGLIRKGSQEEMFQSFINNSYSIYKKIVEGIIPLKGVFSDYIELKLEAFKPQIKAPYPNDIYFICEYDTSKNFTKKQSESYTSDLYIVKKDDNNNLYLLGLKKNGRHYEPQTSRLLLDNEDLDEELSTFLENQIITFINKLEVTNPMNYYCSNPFYASYNAKRQILDILQTLKIRYHAIIDTSKTHQYDLNKLMKNNTISGRKKEVLSIIKDNILKGQIYNIDEYEGELLGEDIVEFILSINDILINRISSDENERSYSELFSQNQAQMSQLESLKNENTQYQSRIQELEKEKAKLEEEKRLLLEDSQELSEVKEKLLEIGNKIRVRGKDKE